MIRLSRTLPGLVALCGLAVARPAALQAQSLPKLAPGTRVRVSAPALRPAAVGFVTAVSNDTMLFQTDDRRALMVAGANVTRLDTSLGMKRNTGKGALIGLAIGGVTGLLVGALDQSGEAVTRSRGETIARTTVGTGMVGAAVGALVGRGRRSDRWDEVALPGVRPVAGAVTGAGLGLTLRF